MGMPNVYGDQLRREASSAASSSWNVTIPPTDASVACPADRRSDRATAQPTSPMQIRVIESDRANTNRRTAPSKSSPSCRSTEHRARAFACRQLAGNAVARPASCRSGAHQTDRPATAPSPFQRRIGQNCVRHPKAVASLPILPNRHELPRRQPPEDGPFPQTPPVLGRPAYHANPPRMRFLPRRPAPRPNWIGSIGSSSD